MSSRHPKNIGKTPKNRPRRTESTPPQPEAQKISLAAYIRTIICLVALAGCTQEPKGCVDVPQLVKDYIGESGDGEKYPPMEKGIKLHDPSGDFYVYHLGGFLRHIIIYIHGFDGDDPSFLDNLKFWTVKDCKGAWTLDDFWKKGQLEEKFKESGVDALIIVPDTTICNFGLKNKRRPNLASMVRLAREKLGIKSEDIDWTLIAHSGGGLIGRPELKNPKIRNFFSLDTLNDQSTTDIENWLKNERNRLILIASTDPSSPKSVARTKKLADKFGAKPYPEIPSKPSSEQCRAKVTYIESPETHGNTKRLIPSAARMAKRCQWHGTRNK